MPKPTFKPSMASGLATTDVEYTPLIYIAGTETFRLALHKDLSRILPEARKGWYVSDPVTGMNVTEVFGDLGGITVSSRGLPPRRARDAAMHTLDALLERIGSEKFVNTINAARAALAVKACT